ncbi:MAG: 50S ribosomal protein L25 [Firmicutes bacterium]|nr:50S ribosomal protein L25 [Bacillota bacterium]
MEIAELKAEKREAAGKEISKKLRRRGMVPAVLYSDGKATALAVNAREFAALAHGGAGTHVIVKLKFPGAKKHPNAIIKEIQRNPVKDEYWHIDFQEIALNERITAAVPIQIVGDAPGVKEGGVLERHVDEVEIEGMPAEMPDHIEVDISGLGLGESIHVGDIKLADNLTLVTDPEAVILTITAPRAAVATIAEEAAEKIAPEAEAGAGEAAAEE